MINNDHTVALHYKTLRLLLLQNEWTTLNLMVKKEPRKSNEKEEANKIKEMKPGSPLSTNSKDRLFQEQHITN